MINLESKEIFDFVQKQIVDTIEQYPFLTMDNLSVSLKEENICFQAHNYIHEEKTTELATAYVNDIKTDKESAIALNTAIILGKLNDAIGGA